MPLLLIALVGDAQGSGGLACLVMSALAQEVTGRLGEAAPEDEDVKSGEGADEERYAPSVLGDQR